MNFEWGDTAATSTKFKQGTGTSVLVLFILVFLFSLQISCNSCIIAGKVVKKRSKKKTKQERPESNGN